MCFPLNFFYSLSASMTVRIPHFFDLICCDLIIICYTVVNTELFCLPVASFDPVRVRLADTRALRVNLVDKVKNIAKRM